MKFEKSNLQDTIHPLKYFVIRYYLIPFIVCDIYKSLLDYADWYELQFLKLLWMNAYRIVFAY